MEYNDDHKGFLCCDLLTRCTRISRNVIFLEDVLVFFFSSLSSDTKISQVSLLPIFPDPAPSSAPLHVYARRPTPPPMVTPGPPPSQLLDSAPPLSGNTSAPATLRQSSRPSKLPERYGFPLLLTNMDSVSIPCSYPRNLVGKRQWLKSFRLLKLTVLGIWSHSPPPDLLLAVSGFIQLKSTQMDT